MNNINNELCSSCIYYSEEFLHDENHMENECSFTHAYCFMPKTKCRHYEPLMENSDPETEWLKTHSMDEGCYPEDSMETETQDNCPATHYACRNNDLVIVSDITDKTLERVGCPVMNCKLCDYYRIN